MTEITRYMELIKKSPELFGKNENLKIIVDETQLRDFVEKENSKLGVIFENEYFWLVVDLIEDTNGRLYPYARIINLNRYNGVVVIPILDNKIVFLRQFRHGTRELEIELPRGFSESSKTAKENAEIEIYEELGVKARNIKYLGNIINDSGLSGGLVHIFLCEIKEIGVLAVNEGIKDIVLLTINEVEDWIEENKIKDCFSLSAIYKLIISRRKKEN